MTPEERPLCPLRDFKPCVGSECAWSVGQEWRNPDGMAVQAYTCAVACMGDHEGGGLTNIIDLGGDIG